MKIPKKIETLLQRRALYADKLQDIDYELSAWIDKNGIECASEDYRGGVEMYVNPYESADSIRQAILRKGNDDE